MFLCLIKKHLGLGVCLSCLVGWSSEQTIFFACVITAINSCYYMQSQYFRWGLTNIRHVSQAHFGHNTIESFCRIGIDNFRALLSGPIGKKYMWQNFPDWRIFLLADPCLSWFQAQSQNSKYNGAISGYFWSFGVCEKLGWGKFFFKWSGLSVAPKPECCITKPSSRIAFYMFWPPRGHYPPRRYP